MGRQCIIGISLVSFVPLAQEIIEDLETALEQFAGIAEGLKK